MQNTDLEKYLDLYPKSARQVHTSVKTKHRVKVTPKQAMIWLQQLFKGQRKISRTHVLDLSEKMKAGVFMDTTQGIVFDWFDRLIDGQHRLLAIIDSGITVEMTVTWGVDPKVYLHLDEDPKSRTVGTFLVKFKKPDQATSAYRVLLDYEHLETRSGSKEHDPRRGYLAFGRRSGSGWKANREAVLSWCSERQKEIEHVLEIVHEPDAKNILPPPGISAGFYLWIYLRWPTEADRFFKALIHGDNLHHEDPIFHLRKTLMRLKNKSLRKMGTAVPYYEWGALLIKAWNAHMDGLRVARISFTANESWPRLTTRKQKKAVAAA